MSDPNAQRELVFCHACDNEWYKDEHGLVCQRCDSEFTEVIERDHDPRAIEQHNPWESAPDPDEEDLTASYHRVRNGRMGSPPPPQNPMAAQFERMLMTMGGNAPQLAEPRFSPSNRDPRHQTTQQFPNTGSRTNITNSGNGFTFTVSTSSRSFAGQPENSIQQLRLEHLGGLMNSLIGPQAHVGRGYIRGENSDDNPIFNLIQAITGSQGNPNDFVTSEEAFARVMTRLMDETRTGNAPPPASEAAIDALPKQNAGTDQLGDTGKAECSICMEMVTKETQIAILPCKHWFHPECAKSWLIEHDTCPICRAGIAPNDDSGQPLRSPGQAPRHNEDPFELARRQSNTQTHQPRLDEALRARRQSGSRDHPILVPESPSRDRRRPSSRSSAGPSGWVRERRSNNANDEAESPSIGSRVRNLFSGNNGGSSGTSR